MTYSGPVIDPHVHLRLDDRMSMTDRPHAPADYLTRMDRVDLIAAGSLVMAPREDLERTRRPNDLVLELAPDPPWYAMCTVHPADGDAAMAELDRVVAAGAKGLKPTSRSPTHGRRTTLSAPGTTSRTPSWRSCATTTPRRSTTSVA